jgi:flagellar motility protein MotE (MotC chaperone)
VQRVPLGTAEAEAPVAQPTAAPTEPAGSSVPPAESPAPAPEAQEAPSEPAADPLAGIDAHDPAVLFERHPGLKRYADSKAGELKSKDLPKLRAEIAAEVRAQFEQEAEERRLAQLAESDDAYGVLEVVKKRNQSKTEREQAELAQQVEAKRLSDLTQHRLGETVVRAFEKLGDAAKGVLFDAQGQPKHFAGDGTAEGGLAEAIQAAIAAGVESTLKERTPKFRAELEAAIRKELNGEALDEPSPDTRGGSPAPGALTRAEFDSKKHDHAWVLKNEPRILDAAARGWR